jgi:hypothetical protein
MNLTKPIGWHIYLAIVLLCVIGGGIPALLKNVSFGKDAMFRCDPFGLNGDNYISYCDASAFTEYDLGAHYFGLEPRAIEALRKADVLFLGNSRTGHTFSSQATQSEMRSLGIANYYVAGFGYEGSSHIALLLMKKYNVHPKAIVINADPFFTDDYAPILATLTSGRQSVYLEYLTKKYFQKTQWYLCSIYNFGCGTRPTVYRTLKHGFWETERFEKKVLEFLAIQPIVEPATVPTAREIVAEPLARDFIASVATARSCIIITSIPSPRSMRSMAETVARKNSLPFFAPVIPGLRTYDNSHLLAEDGERWSKVMFAEAHDTIARCMKNEIAK